MPSGLIEYIERDIESEEKQSCHVLPVSVDLNQILTNMSIKYQITSIMDTNCPKHVNVLGRDTDRHFSERQNL
jgi:hypothetical protein